MPYSARHKQATRERIVEASRVLFNRHGFEGVTIDMVMDAAGLTRGCFYNHFESKEKLYGEAVLSFLNGRGAEWRAEAGVERVTAHGVAKFETGRVHLECIYSGKFMALATEQLIPITARIPSDDLWLALERRRHELEQCGLLSLQRIGDCRAPGLVAAAIYAGHRAARELGGEAAQARRERMLCEI